MISVSRFKRRSASLLVTVVLLALLACAQQGVYHQVKEGQTLYRISRAYGVDEIYLARVNGIADPKDLLSGTRLYIPGATSVKRVAAVKPRRIPKSAVNPPTAPKAVRPAVKNKPPAKISAPSKGPVSAAKKGTLAWPLRGKLLSAFKASEKSGGKGIEIAAPHNSAVKAAAAGQVIYSGDGVKGYGHLIILQHENDLYTVYGFNTRNLVQQGEFVSGGEKIALSGNAPGGGVPRLHFEVRRQKQAVNPILYLP
ncbi:MAG: peptidase M23 [Desulfuromonas sp.]|nr:MAG: peptidase M23 [Desulfuromonas sp.]